MTSHDGAGRVDGSGLAIGAGRENQTSIAHPAERLGAKLEIGVALSIAEPSPKDAGRTLHLHAIIKISGDRDPGRTALSAPVVRTILVTRPKRSALELLARERAEPRPEDGIIKVAASDGQIDDVGGDDVRCQVSANGKG